MSGKFIALRRQPRIDETERNHGSAVEARASLVAAVGKTTMLDAWPTWD
ncbi:MAG: hypothetical protein IPM07_07570 [Anaerolineales bacterium]|nr:hypothetical protein [Anaerolineales bacterium]